MAKYKVTLIVESDEDPSVILDEFEYFVTESADSCILERNAVDDGEAVSVAYED